MQIVILMTLLTLLPALVMSITPFLRIAIVLHFLRQALGTQTVPSNQVLVGLATIAEARVKTAEAGYDVLPANRELARVIYASNAADRDRLKHVRQLLVQVLEGT